MPQQNVPPIKPEQKKNTPPAVPPQNEEYSGGSKRDDYENANPQRQSDQYRDSQTGESLNHSDDSKRRASQAEEELIRPLKYSDDSFQQDDEDFEDDMDYDDINRNISP